jgi:hypothetical protein
MSTLGRMRAPYRQPRFAEGRSGSRDSARPAQRSYSPVRMILMSPKEPRLDCLADMQAIVGEMPGSRAEGVRAGFHHATVRVTKAGLWPEPPPPFSFRGYGVAAREIGAAAVAKRADRRVVGQPVLARAIRSRHADNAHPVSAVSRCGQTRDRACSTRDETQIAASQEGPRSVAGSGQTCRHGGGLGADSDPGLAHPNDSPPHLAKWVHLTRRGASAPRRPEATVGDTPTSGRSARPRRRQGDRQSQ